MNSDQLFYLLALTQYPSMNMASQQLHITPSALSISIKNLETELQLQLINRTSRGVTLTDNGKKVAHLAQKFFIELDQIKATLPLNMSDSPSGKCTIYSVQGALSDLLPKVICDFYSQYPLVQVIVETASIPDIASHFNHNSNDPHEIALIFVGQANEKKLILEKDYVFYPLMRVKLLARVHERFSIASSKKLSLKTILKYPIIIHNPSPQLPEENPSFKFLASVCPIDQVIFESNFQIYQNMIQLGMGIGFEVASPLLSSNLPIQEHTNTIPLKDVPPLSLGYVVNQNKPLSQAAQIFLDFLINYIDCNTFSTN